ncbi:AMP-binding protein [Mycolicibacterium sp. 120270]|uniref:AMP-binding protein n=1 Tax=Mycolicibacterium sp. 120270 TaxID=3090600 RepID=UPI00299D7C23|nr:AMP-binding protein [Mycolicibacterium sp. 120270]MDX1886221.1 AMP-binding protein [Mycolicibacterium sp. 120270]
MTQLVEHLRHNGERVAVLTATITLTYRELADRVADIASRLGETRRLVLIETHNDLSTLVHYLGALAGGHVVLPMSPGRSHSAVIRAYDPDVVIDGDAIHERRPGSAHRLHPDLALLLSTSGSTGSPKLVRLSHRNLVANAEAIAEYLDIRQSDRAATTLPMSYCYGLSVIHSHLLRGAGLILTDRSVVDDEFWTLFREHRGTSFAGVPYTFEMLDRIGFDGNDLPDLRYVTQAGGRLAPERVRSFAALGARNGWQLFVMYGATEATARMAYLPPELAETSPASIGGPIPGGSFTLEPLDGWPDPDVGELVYQGPNVMMGYAHGPVDLALGKTVETLRTGDVARRTPDGLYEVIGRSSRFVKIYGLRIDLHRVEAALSAEGVTAFCTDDDERLVIATVDADSVDVQRITVSASGLPASAVRVVKMAELPLLPSGKPDYQAIREHANRIGKAGQSAGDLRALFADVLQVDARTIRDDQSFVDLGGNSLSYVAMSVRLERALGRLPSDWQRRPVAELERTTPPARRSWPWLGATLETSVALRAIAIVLIVGSHATLYEMWGGAHLLLGIAGYNFGRFCLTPVPRADRVRHLRKTLTWIVVPSVLWIALALLITDDYHWTNLFLAEKFFGPDHSMTAGRLWFIEVLVWILLALTLVVWLPAADRMERRRPFAFAAVFLVFGLAVRYDLLGLHFGREAWFTILAFWFFAVGWAAAKSSTVWQHLLVTAVLVVSVYGYFENTNREMLVLAGFLLLIWLPAIRCPAWCTVVAGTVAEASLYTYLTHYQIYPLFDANPLLGVIAAIVVGVLITRLVDAARTRFRVRSEQGTTADSVPALR